MQGKGVVHLSMLGGLAIAMLLDLHLGYIVTYNLIFFASLVGQLSIESIVYLLILETLMCMLSGYLKKMSTAGYVIVIVLSTQVILLFIMNNFILQNSFNINAVHSVLSTLVVMSISSGGYYLYQNKIKSSLKQPEELIGTHSWNEILDLDFPLIQRLKQCSTKLYNHSLLISELSGNAAKVAGVNELIAKAGGLYHEIGRIESKNYVQEGVMLVEAYHLPTMIADIIRQHNLKYEKPKTPEAAIVMITVSLISTKEYLEKTAKDSVGEKDSVVPVPIEKIIDNVFQLRLSKGSLDESGLTLQQFNKLKEYYLHM
jgi:putative nucleotidyltransferase with HDIG domain